MKYETAITAPLNGHIIPHPFHDAEGRALFQPRIERLLQVLSRDVGQTVSRQQLLDEIWDGDPSYDGALTVAVCTLRRYLRDDCLRPRFIETVRGQGYRLITPVPAEEYRGAQLPTVLPVAPGENDAEASRNRARYPFMADLVRRRVFRVLTLYLIVGWIVLQVGEVTFEPLGVPVWGLTLLVLLVGLGFPVAAVLAWAFQITPAGVVLEVPKAHAAEVAGATASRRFHGLIIACLICALAAAGFRLIELEWRNAQIASSQNIVATVAEHGSTNSRGAQVPLVNNLEAPGAPER